MFDEIKELEATEAVTPYEFDADFQKKIVALLLQDTTFVQMTHGLIQPEFFENVAHAVWVKIASDYFAKYKKAPGDRATLVSLMKGALVSRTVPREIGALAIPVLTEVLSADVSDRHYVADKCAEFARHQAVSKAILDSVELISKGDFDRVGVMVRKALDTGVNPLGGIYDYADMIDRRTKDRDDIASGKRPASGITTGFPILDDCLLHKGWGRKELSILMGAAKSGKSMGLISFGISAIAAGYKVLYVTLEVSQEIIAQRMDANIAELAMAELGLRRHEVQDRVRLFMDKAAPFKIHEAPTGSMRPSDLSRLIEKFKAQGDIFDLVIVDYADLMIPDRATESTTENSKSVYLNLRGLAMQEGFAMLSATQTNREGSKKAVATMTDVADDINKIRIADIVISINKSAEETSLGQARLYFAACRNQRSGFSVRINQSVDQAKFITTVIGED